MMLIKMIMKKKKMFVRAMKNIESCAERDTEEMSSATKRKQTESESKALPKKEKKAGVQPK